MAYVLGFFAADGNMIKNKQWKVSYRLQIGSKQIFNDLLLLGLSPNKSKIIELPNVPEKYFPHFLRGYFDGDGNVIFGLFKKSDRKSKSPALLTRFTAGSKLILEKLHTLLAEKLNTKGSLFYCGEAWRLSYSINDSKKLFSFMYNNGKVADLIYLKRKYNIYKQAILGR